MLAKRLTEHVHIGLLSDMLSNELGRVTVQAALNEVAATILLENEQATATDLLREMVTSLGVVDWEAYKVFALSHRAAYVDLFLWCMCPPIFAAQSGPTCTAGHASSY